MAAEGVSVCYSSERSVAEVYRDVRVLAKDSARPQKQLVRRGTLCHATGDVAGWGAAAAGARSLLEEVEWAVAADGMAPPATWQAAEPQPRAVRRAKLFLHPTRAMQGDVTEAVGETLRATGGRLQQLVLSVGELDCDLLLALWAEACALRADGTVQALGLADLDPKTLAWLLAHAPAPDTVQALWADTVAVDGQLQALCRAHGVALSTHGDTDTRLEGMQGGLGQALGLAGARLAPQWVLRHTAVAPDRAVLLARAYVLKANYTLV